MQDELKLFEKNLTRDLTSFQEHGRVVPRKPRPVPALAASRGIEVRLMVRMKRLSFLDEEFVTVVDTISELEARLEAEKRARAAGWPYIGYVIDMKPTQTKQLEFFTTLTDIL